MEKLLIEILLIEDNEDHAELVINELKGAGKLINNINLVKNGKDALDYLFNKGKYKDSEKYPKPGLIILDLKLPKVDGLEVLKKIKANPELKVIPVVVLTTSGDEEDVELSYKYGANSYITKPVKFEKFVKVIQDIRLYWVLTNIGPDIKYKINN